MEEMQMPAVPPEANENRYSDKLNFRWILMSQLERVNFIGTQAHNSRQYVDAVETLCINLMGIEVSNKKATTSNYIQQIEDVENEFMKRYDEARSSQKSKQTDGVLIWQIKCADKKRRLAIIYMSGCGLLGTTSGSEYLG
jgi:hypothetical protein